MPAGGHFPALEEPSGMEKGSRRTRRSFIWVVTTGNMRSVKSALGSKVFAERLVLCWGAIMPFAGVAAKAP
jgi:hypothetical protein